MPPKQMTPLGLAILTAALALPCISQGQGLESEEERGLPVFDQQDTAQSAAVTGASPRSAASGGGVVVPPKVSVLQLDFLRQQEAQPSSKRIKATVVKTSLAVPFADNWSVQAGYTKDIVSGASPRFWTKGAASMRDTRIEQEIAVTRYFVRDTVSLGASVSNEHDCYSQGVSVSGTHLSAGRDTTISYGVVFMQDKITALDLNKTRHRVKISFGLARTLSPQDKALLVLEESQGRGFFSQPFRWMDVRPSAQYQHSITGAWLHRVFESEATWRVSYRYSTDSWSVKSHTLGIEYAQPLGSGWLLTPRVQIHDQSAAKFYVDQANFPGTGPYVSFDQHLSAFGAHTYGVTLSKTFEQNWALSLKYDRYLQQTHWRIFGNGSPNLEPLSADIIQLGLSRSF